MTSGQPHVVDAMRSIKHPLTDTLRPEIEQAVRHVARERSRVVYVEGDLGTGKTILTTLLAMQMFWEVHCGAWRGMKMPSGVPVWAACRAPHRSAGEYWYDNVVKMLRELDPRSRGTDVGPHPCRVTTFRDTHRMQGLRNVVCLVTEEGTMWSPEEFGQAARHMNREYPSQIVRVNPYLHQAQWAGCKPGVYTIGDTTVIRLRLRPECHVAIWKEDHGSF